MKGEDKAQRAKRLERERRQESDGLWGEIIERYGKHPPIRVLLEILKHHDVKVNESDVSDDGKHITVYSHFYDTKTRENGTEILDIPANLRSVMEFLGY